MSAKDSAQEGLETENVALDVDNKESSDKPRQSNSPSPEVEEADGEPTPDPTPGLEPQDSPTAAAAPVTPWQAIWAPQYNAYYFYNSVTQETTWINPLQPSSSYSTAPSESPNEQSAEAGSSSAGMTSVATAAAAASHYSALHDAAIAQGIDPGLAHLDPTLLASVQGSSSIPGDVPTFTAQFNAHTGKFAAASSRTPGHLSEYERMKRMSEFYFDVNKWEEDLARQHEEETALGKKRKRPTKKDLERFKEQKRLKKIAKTAWLRT